MAKDRYTRLRAIKEFGYDIDWEKLRDFHIAVIGIGGLGCVSSEMAVRCGIGKLTLFDFDNVDIVNLNRSMYKEEHIGKPKVIIASRILKEINPEVNISYQNTDIMDPNYEKSFEKELRKIDLVLNGLDNIPAREYLNAKCISLNVPYIDAGASRSGLSGYIHPVIPFETACYNCIKNISINLPDDRGEPCVASLPSTMAIIASIQIQEMLKYLLKFGQMIDYVMYDMISGKFLNYSTKRDQNCVVCGDKEIESNQDTKPNVSNKDLDNLIKNLKE
ncbi:MAG: HesA/MoeB/ThiF family protein [Candidatus Thorarchaeota archaeon]